MRLEAGTWLITVRARTWKNSRPRNSPRPTCRSTSSSSANSVPWGSSSTVRHRSTCATLDEHTFADNSWKPKGATAPSAEVRAAVVARPAAGGDDVVEPVALVDVVRSLHEVGLG